MNINNIIRRIETSLSNRPLTGEEERLCSMLRPADALLYAAYLRGNLTLGRLVLASQSLPDHWVWHRPLKVNVWFALRLARLTWDALQEAQGVSGDTEPAGWSAEKRCWDSEGHYGFTAELVNQMAYAAGCKVGSSKYNWLAKRLVRLYLDSTAGPCSGDGNYAINSEGYYSRRKVADLKRVPVRLLGAYLKGIDRACGMVKRVDLLVLGRVCAASAWILLNGDARCQTSYEDRGRQLAWEAYRTFRSATDEQKALMLPAHLAWQYTAEGWGDGRIEVPAEVKESNIVLRVQSVAVFTHKETGEEVHKPLVGYHNFLSSYEERELMGEEAASYSSFVAQRYTVWKGHVHPSHVAAGIDFTSLSYIEGLVEPRQWWHEEHGYDGHSAPTYAKWGQESWEKMKAEFGLITWQEGMQSFRVEGRKTFYVLNGIPYLEIPTGNGGDWFVPAALVPVYGDGNEFVFQRVGKFIVGYLTASLQWRRHANAPFIVSTEHGIELSGENATWARMKEACAKMAERKAKEDAINAVRDGLQPVSLSLSMCKQAGFCINGTRDFLYDKMPFVASLIREYRDWDDVPEDIMTMVQEVQVDWCGYESYLNRL